MRRSFLKCASRIEIKRFRSSPTQIYSPFRCFLQSPKAISTDACSCRSDTVKDLITSYGLSEQIRVHSTKYSWRHEEVFNFLENQGFSEAQIRILVSKSPKILVTSIHNTLKPKMDFLNSIGISRADVVNLITATPYILGRSVKKQFIPTFDLLKTLLGGQKRAVNVIKRRPLILRFKTSKYLVPNVEILRNLGIPNSRVLKLITGSYVMSSNTPLWFSKLVAAVKELGFDPLLPSFEYALMAKGSLSESTWDEKVNFYQSLGFSKEETICMFRKQPNSMSYAKERIRGAVNFCINKLHWSRSQFAKRPNVLTYSLEKRIIPRCSVLQILASRNLIGKNMHVSTILVMTEMQFYKRFVTKYKDEVPEVLDAYHGKLKVDEYNFGSGETDVLTEF